MQDQRLFSGDEGEIFRTPPSTPKLNGSCQSSPHSTSSYNRQSSSTALIDEIGAGLQGSLNIVDEECLKVNELMKLLKVGDGQHKTPPNESSISISQNIQKSQQQQQQQQQIQQQQQQQVISDLATADQPPCAPPRRRDKSKNLLAKKPSTSPHRSSVNGLPPTPKVHMGACFSKVFNECPLRILCSASWIHPDTRDQHILLGCEEGLYTLNLSELADACIDQLFPRRTSWMYVIKDVLMTISGKSTTHLYRHDLVQLHAIKGSTSSSSSTKFGAQVDSMINKIPDRFVPWKLSATSKIADTKGCSRCCVGRNAYNGYKYLCGISPLGIFLMQWYNPLNKFMKLKVSLVYHISRVSVKVCQILFYFNLVTFSFLGLFYT